MEYVVYFGIMLVVQAVAVFISVWIATRYADNNDVAIAKKIVDLQNAENLLNGFTKGLETKIMIAERAISNVRDSRDAVHQKQEIIFSEIDLLKEEIKKLTPKQKEKKPTLSREIENFVNAHLANQPDGMKLKDIRKEVKKLGIKIKDATLRQCFFKMSKAGLVRSENGVWIKN